MAAARAQEASSSTSRCLYHVFLSFRGEDTRKNFTDHLYTALLQAGFHTFRDDDEIDRGNNIESELQKALEQSKISIIVFSKSYASSRWCLDELVMILERKRTFRNFVVLPVFYDVNPSQVRNQAGSLAEAFATHEERFKKDNKELEMWRAALREAADLAGMVLQNQADGHESKFIQKIVQEVRTKLNRTTLSVAPYLIGIESRIREINSWLQDGASLVQKVVLYGIGGIGKTTIAKTVYNLNAENFEARSFLANVRDISAHPNGSIRLQKQLLFDILKGRKEKINSIDEGIFAIEETTCCKKVLLVLDDVDEEVQIRNILGWRNWFKFGSKIIITTRHKGLLKPNLLPRICDGVNELEVKELDNDESLQLLSWHAFGQKHPIKSYMELSKKVLYHCGGLPLALQILGSSLSGKSQDAWESAINKLKEIPDSQIQKALQISYESLLDDHDKNLFLDIACFFIGKDRDYTVKILDECGFYTTIGIHNLIDRCLVTINNDNKLMMHQLLRDMGREIIRQESPKEPGKRSRLWWHNDALNVLKELTGTETIEGIFLESHKLHEEKFANAISDVNNTDRIKQVLYKGKKPSQRKSSLGRVLQNSWNPKRAAFHRFDVVSNELDLKTDAFARMHKLRLLQLNYAQLTGGYEKLPKTLRWLCWHGFPSKTIPNDFCLDNLVALDMCNSSLELIWKGTRFLRYLKILNLSKSPYLTKTPNFSGLPNLEILMFKDCISLAEVHESIGNLKRLVYLNLKGCKNLRKLPREIGMVNSIQKLILSGCSKLEELPELEKMESLTVFHADGTAINRVFSDGEGVARHNHNWNLTSRRKTPMYINFALNALPRTLVSLSLANCNLLDDAIPSDISILFSLHDLNLSGNPITRLPTSIRGLTKLQSLQLDGCTRLQSLPDLPTSLKDLIAKDCTALERIENLPNLLQSLHLEFFGCNKLVEVKGLFKLEPIENTDTEMINNVGLFNLDSTEGISVKLASNMTYTERKSPLQGLYECGIFSIFLPGIKVPDWFSHKSMKTSISFEVSPDSKIQGLNVCVVYQIMQYSSLWGPGFGDVHFLHITNRSKGLKWTYCPTFYGIPEGNEYMLWLSHMKFGSDQFQCGDEVMVKVVMANGFLPKQCGVQLVYDEEEQELQSDCQGMILVGTYPPHHNVIDEAVSASEARVGGHLLCHHRFISHRINTVHDFNKLSGFDICFVGSANCWPVIGVSRPNLDSLWAPKVVEEENEITGQEIIGDWDFI